MAVAAGRSIDFHKFCVILWFFSNRCWIALGTNHSICAKTTFCCIVRKHSKKNAVIGPFYDIHRAKERSYCNSVKKRVKPFKNFEAFREKTTRFWRIWIVHQIVLLSTFVHQWVFNVFNHSVFFVCYHLNFFFLVKSI